MLIFNKGKVDVKTEQKEAYDEIYFLNLGSDFINVPITGD